MTLQNLDRVKAIIKYVDEIPSVHDLLYDIEQMEEYKKGLLTYAKLKVGEFIKLSKTPEINSRVRWGWLSYKNLLVEGVVGEVREVDWYKGQFRYSINFVEDKQDHQFCFEEEFLEKAPTVKEKSLNRSETFELILPEGIPLDLAAVLSMVSLSKAKKINVLRDDCKYEIQEIKS
jgi:hypothetical protein